MIGYEVIPRYSCGSPSMVDRKLAERIKHDETEMIKGVLEGMHGPEEAARAERLGLDGIVLEAKIKDHKIEYRDMITGVDYGAVPMAVFRNDPDTLIVKQEPRQNVYFFRRKRIYTEPLKYPAPGQIVRTLRDLGLDEETAWHKYLRRMLV